MNIEEFNKCFEIELSKNNIHLNKEKYSNFYYYMEKIIEWNEKINLTAITDEKDFIVKHYIDSLTINNFISSDDQILDIGTGAGFPGMPIKLANPETRITLIDAINKKLNAIKSITDEMEISGLQILHTRAEELGKKIEFREKYDLVVTRAVSNLSTLAEYMLPFVKVGKVAICMKGPNIEEEIQDGKKAIEVLGGKVERIENIIINDEMVRNLIIIRKIKTTPNKYPRCGGKPLKEPIK